MLIVLVEVFWSVGFESVSLRSVNGLESVSVGMFPVSFLSTLCRLGESLALIGSK